MTGQSGINEVHQIKQRSLVGRDDILQGIKRVLCTAKGADMRPDRGDTWDRLPFFDINEVVATPLLVVV